MVTRMTDRCALVRHGYSLHADGQFDAARGSSRGGRHVEEGQKLEVVRLLTYLREMLLMVS